MERLFNDYLAYNARAKAIADEFGKHVSAVIADSADVDLRDLATILSNEVHALISDAVLRRAYSMRKEEKAKDKEEKEKAKVEEVCANDIIFRHEMMIKGSPVQVKFLKARLCETRFSGQGIVFHTEVSDRFTVSFYTVNNFAVWNFFRWLETTARLMKHLEFNDSFYYMKGAEKVEGTIHACDGEIVCRINC